VVAPLIIRRRRSIDHLAEGLLDRNVVERARSGDQDAFADLVHQVSDTLLGVARRILRDPTLAEDVLQNALLTIWRKLPHLRDADRFEGWAFRILVHACYADAPRNRRWASTIRVLHTDVASDADDIQMISDRDELEQAFRRLPLDQRAVFVLHHHVGLPLVAVAEILGIPDGTARSRLHYATRALRVAFEAARATQELREGRLA
jgi:RNA polymerase sigma-70 factor, ECF subfamily